MSIDLSQETTEAPAATRREWIGLAVLDAADPAHLDRRERPVRRTAHAQPRARRDQHPAAVDPRHLLVPARRDCSSPWAGSPTGSAAADCFSRAASPSVPCRVLAAYAQSPEMLIAARALLGVAGATLMPSTMALIRHMFPRPEQMGQAISIWMACFMGGMTAGPVVGGALLERFWWGSAFLIGVPVMVLLVLVAPRLLPDSPRSGGHALPDARLRRAVARHDPARRLRPQGARPRSARQRRAARPGRRCRRRHRLRPPPASPGRPAGRPGPLREPAASPSASPRSWSPAS